MAHVIRLRGPWEYRLLATATKHRDLSALHWQSAPTAPMKRIDIPFSVPTAAMGPQSTMHGRILLVRRFNSPTNLSPNERVSCVFRNAQSLRRVALNDHEFGSFETPISDWRCDISAALARRNELSLDVETQISDDGQPLAFTGEVSLEIQ